MRRSRDVSELVANLGTVAEARSHFREFVRAQIGARWYRASDYSLWRFHWKARKVNEVQLGQDANGNGIALDLTWINDQSVSDQTNNGF